MPKRFPPYVHSAESSPQIDRGRAPPVESRSWPEVEMGAGWRCQLKRDPSTHFSCGLHHGRMLATQFGPGL